MIFNPTLITEEKIVEKPGYLPDVIVTVKDTTVPLWEMAQYNSYTNIRNNYTKTRKVSYRDFSGEIGGGN